MKHALTLARIGQSERPSIDGDDVLGWALARNGRCADALTYSRAALRRHFGTDAAHVVVAVLKGLVDADLAKPEEVADAIASYGIDPESVEPRLA